MTRTLDESIEFAKEVAREIIESGEQHQPIMLTLTPQGRNIMLLSGIDKDEFQHNMATLLRQFNAYAYIYIDEAWVTNLPADCPTVQKLLRGDVTVSELPPDDKDEILMIMAAENGKSICSWMAKIRYTRDDKRYLDEWEKMDKVGEGRMILRKW